MDYFLYRGTQLHEMQGINVEWIIGLVIIGGLINWITGNSTSTQSSKGTRPGHLDTSTKPSLIVSSQTGAGTLHTTPKSSYEINAKDGQTVDSRPKEGSMLARQARPLAAAHSVNESKAAAAPITISAAARAHGAVDVRRALQQQSIKAEVSSRGIHTLYHFTRASNLKSIAQRGLLSVKQMDDDRVSFFRNDAYRFDKRLNAISLSVSFPNHRMFYRYRKEDPLQRWAVIELSPAILYELDCLFCPYNAADKRISSRDDKELRTQAAFKEMFAEATTSLRPAYLEPFDPTDEQAEILVLHKIGLKYVTGVILDDQDSYAAQAAALDGSLPLRFSDSHSVIFNSRQYVRRRGMLSATAAGYRSEHRKLDFVEYNGDIPF